MRTQGSQPRLKTIVSVCKMFESRQAGPLRYAVTAHHFKKLVNRCFLRTPQPRHSIFGDRAPRLTTGPKAAYSNNATDMTYRDIGTRLTGRSHMMLECKEHTVRPATSSNVNQHLTGRHPKGVRPRCHMDVVAILV